MKNILEGFLDGIKSLTTRRTLPKGDAFSLRGDVRITIDGPDGQRVIEKKNLIVTLGKKLIVRHLGGDAAYDTNNLTKISFGDNSAAPALTDTAALTGEIVEKTGTVTYPADNQLKVTATLGTGEGNGGGTQIYEDVRLKTGTDEFLFSRLLTGSITKTSSVSLTVEWTISVQ